jgi:hypothetical protein
MRDVCSHDGHARLALEFYEMAEYRVNPGDEPVRLDDASSKAWEGGVTFRCGQCGFVNRYNSRRLPPFVLVAMKSLGKGFWDAVEQDVPEREKIEC